MITINMSVSFATVCEFQRNKFSLSLIQMNSKMISGGGGGTLQSFIRGGPAPRSYPSPLCIPLFTEKEPISYEVLVLLICPLALSHFEKFKVSILYPFYRKRITRSHTYQEDCTPFLNLCNEVNEQYYERTSSITRRHVNQTTQVLLVQKIAKSQTVWKKLQTDRTKLKCRPRASLINEIFTTMLEMLMKNATSEPQTGKS